MTASQSASQPLRVSFGSTLIRVLSIEDKNCQFYNSFLFTSHTSSFALQFQCFSSSVHSTKTQFSALNSGPFRLSHASQCQTTGALLEVQVHRGLKNSLRSRVTLVRFMTWPCQSLPELLQLGFPRGTFPHLWRCPR